MDKTALRDLALHRLQPFPVSARAMFGGFGLYLDGRFFGLISSEGRVYFRTDDASRADYLARGSRAFQPSSRPAGPKTMPRNFEVPAEIFDDVQQLRRWARRAAEAVAPVPRRPRRASRGT